MKWKKHVVHKKIAKQDFNTDYIKKKINLSL